MDLQAERPDEVALFGRGRVRQIMGQNKHEYTPVGGKSRANGGRKAAKKD